jgi:hypothetical protein
MMQRRQGSQLIPPALLCGVERPNVIEFAQYHSSFFTLRFTPDAASGATPVKILAL